jgi:hypothetical protein
MLVKLNSLAKQKTINNLSIINMMKFWKIFHPQNSEISLSIPVTVFKLRPLIHMIHRNMTQSYDMAKSI